VAWNWTGTAGESRVPEERDRDRRANRIIAGADVLQDRVLVAFSVQHELKTLVVLANHEKAFEVRSLGENMGYEEARPEAAGGVLRLELLFFLASAGRPRKKSGRRRHVLDRRAHPLAPLLFPVIMVPVRACW
jgi:hypothetical protein